MQRVSKLLRFQLELDIVSLQSGKMVVDLEVVCQPVVVLVSINKGAMLVLVGVVTEKSNIPEWE